MGLNQLGEAIDTPGFLNFAKLAVVSVRSGVNLPTVSQTQACL